MAALNLIRSLVFAALAFLKTRRQLYHSRRTHLSLDKDCPEPRNVEPPETGQVVELPVMGGLHHRVEGLLSTVGMVLAGSEPDSSHLYTRRAAWSAEMWLEHGLECA